MITPSYEHYGTHDESAYPELWEGCVGAWFPGLGYSQVIRDLSGRQRNLFPYTTGQEISARNGYGAAYVQSSPQHFWQSTEKFHVELNLLSKSASLVAWIAQDELNNGSIVGDTAFHIQSVGGTLYVGFYNAGYARFSVGGFGGLVANYWNSVVASFDSRINVASLFINGKLQSRIACEAPAYSDSMEFFASIGEPFYLAAATVRVASLVYYARALSDEEAGLASISPAEMCVPRRRRRFYSIPTAAFMAAWARNRSAQILGGGLR